MDTETLKVIAQVAGIGGIALGVFLVLFKEIIRKNIFPQLSKVHSFQLLRLIALLVWTVALAGIAAWVWVETRPQDSSEAAVMEPQARPDINGSWQATVVYDWPNARYDETFEFRGAGENLLGTASFLGRTRGIVEGTVQGSLLDFVTETLAMQGGSERSTRHRYSGTVSGEEIRFVMQTTGDVTEHLPVEFTATRVRELLN